MAATVRTQTPQLELGHVLFVEIVGELSPPTSDQRNVLEQLQEVIRRTAEFNKAYAREQLIALAASDAMALVFFTNPEEALRCAAEISRSARKMASLHLRMGVHSGPVYRSAHINCEDRIADGGINTLTCPTPTRPRSPTRPSARPCWGAGNGWAGHTPMGSGTTTSTRPS